MSKTNKYFAFISYKREDEEWAVWFHHELENYHLPVSLNGRSDLPSQFRPVFRDIDELKAGNLPEQIHNALSSSAYLIVICSPNAAKSEWVNKEILDFIEIGRNAGIDNINNIFPFIVDGRPHAKAESEECFPKALLELNDNDERIGGNVNESGRDMAFVKVLAGMLPNVEFSELWNRYERDKAEEERLKREERERFLRVQSRFVAERVIDITHNSTIAQLLALEVLPKDLNNPERPYTLEAERALRQSTAQHHAVLSGHPNDISGLSFSSDGKFLVSIDDFSIRVWDIISGDVISIIDPKHPFGRCVRFMPDDRSIISVFGDGAIITWSIDSGEPISELDFNQTFQTQRPATCINSIAISPDGTKIAMASLEGDIFILDLDNNKISSVEIAPVHSIEFSHDGRMLVSTSDDGLIVWNLENDTHGSLGLNEDVELEFAHASFSLNGEKVAFAFDYSVGIVNVMGDGSLKTFNGGEERFVYTSFCDSGKSIVAISEFGELFIWDINSQQLIYKAKGVAGEVGLATYMEEQGRVGFVVDKRTIVVQDIRPTTYLQTFIQGEEQIGVVAYSPNGDLLLTTCAEIEKGDITIWDVASGLVIRKLLGHTGKVWSASFSPNGELVVSASYDGSISIWEVKTGVRIKTLTTEAVIGENTAFTNAVFSPDGLFVAGSLYTGWIIVWDYNAEAVIFKMNHGNNPIFALDYSSDGSIIASGSINQDIRIWDAKKGGLLKVLIGHTGIINAVCFSHDGQRLFSASDDNTIICWDVREERIIWRNMSFSDKVKSIKHSWDGKYVVAISYDCEKPIVVCDSKTGKILATYKGLVEPANSVAFSPNGSNIAADVANGVFAIWNFPSLQELMDSTREALSGKVLSPEEQELYYLE